MPVRVLGLFLTLTLIFFTAILAVRLICGTQPNPLALLFTNPDGSPCEMPCLFGVRPGETTLDEGEKLLARHPLTRGMAVEMGARGQSATFDSKGVSVSLSSNTGNIVGYMILGYQFAGSSDTTTPDLLSAMRQADPGNEVLLLGIPQNGLMRSPYDPGNNITNNAYCYFDYRLCFNTIKRQEIHDWQTETFTSLSVNARLIR